MTPNPWALEFHPEAWALSIGLLVLYFWTLRTHGPTYHPRPDDPPATTRQKAAFVAGVAVLWFSAAGPIHDIGEHYLFSAHMLQHLLEVLVVPPLLLVGTPAWMFRLLIRNDRVRKFVGRASRPLVATLVFNGALMALHIPALMTASIGNEPLHLGVHVVLVATAIFMWMPVMSPVDEIPRLSPLAQLGYLFIQTILPTVPASALTFGNAVLYPVYETFPRLWGISAADDMRFSGLIMKTVAGFYLWGIITVKFFRWANGEERRERAERQPRPIPTVTTGS